MRLTNLMHGLQAERQVYEAQVMRQLLGRFRRRRTLLVAFALILIVGAILLSIAMRMTPNVRQ